jgi:hypothetical protein
MSAFFFLNSIFPVMCKELFIVQTVKGGGGRRNARLLGLRDTEIVNVLASANLNESLVNRISGDLVQFQS